MKSSLYPYSLEEGSRKYPCPKCHKKRFKRYVNHYTHEYIHPDVGRCEREESCAFHYPPRLYFERFGNAEDTFRNTSRAPRKGGAGNKGRLPFWMVEKSGGVYHNNQLVQWLSTLPGWDSTMAAGTVQQYHVGTGKEGTAVAGWPIFWQIDEGLNVRTGKLIKYDTKTGKRTRNDVYSMDWIHSMLTRKGHIPDDANTWKLDQCLFGLHLIRDNDAKPIAIVESEKTALIASQYLPSFTWLACGSLNGLKQEMLKPLQGRSLILYPDRGMAYKKWKTVAGTLQGFKNVLVSDILERHTTSSDDGNDLADYLIQYDIRSFKGSTCYQVDDPHNTATDQAEGTRSNSDGEALLATSDRYPSKTNGTSVDDDRMLYLLVQSLECVHDPTVAPEEINRFWDAADSLYRPDTWRK